MTKDKAPPPEPLSEAEIRLIGLHVEGKMEREHPDEAALIRGCLATIRALQADCNGLETERMSYAVEAATLREALEEALIGLKWWQETYPDGASEADVEFEERAKAALSPTARAEERCPICENILEYRGQECKSDDHDMIPKSEGGRA